MLVIFEFIDLGFKLNVLSIFLISAKYTRCALWIGLLLFIIRDEKIQHLLKYCI